MFLSDELQQIYSLASTKAAARGGGGGDTTKVINLVQGMSYKSYGYQLSHAILRRLVRSGR